MASKTQTNWRAMPSIIKSFDFCEHCVYAKEDRVRLPFGAR